MADNYWAHLTVKILLGSYLMAVYQRAQNLPVMGSRHLMVGVTRDRWQYRDCKLLDSLVPLEDNKQEGIVEEVL